MNRIALGCALSALLVIGCSSQSDGVVTPTTSSPKLSGNVLTTVTYHPINGGRFDPQGVSIDGRTFAGQHSQTTSGVEVICFLATEKCFTVNASGTQVDVNQAGGGSGVGGGTGYWITEGPW